MADPIKFVQLDCHLDDKFDYIEAEFGLEGFAIVVKLFQRIYGGQGYYCEWNDRVAMLFAKRIGAGCNVVREVVSAAIREGIFSEEMFENYGVLTSHGIQKRFYDVAKRREVIFDKPEYVLFNAVKKLPAADNSAPNAYNQGENVCNETTSKAKLSKAKLSEAKLSIAGERPAPAAPAAKSALAQKYGSEIIEEYERRFDKWRDKKGSVNVDKYQTIGKWLEQDCVPELSDRSSSFDVDEVMEEIRARYSNADIL